MIDSFTGEHRFLSNFWPAQVKYKGIVFPNVECAYQAAKCADPGEMHDFVDLSAKDAKQLGSKVELREDWDEIKIPTMLFLVRRKFRIDELKEKLLATGSQELVEGNWWHDTFWGVCIGCGHKRKDTGKGENHLGRILMQVREELAGEALGL